MISQNLNPLDLSSFSSKTEFNSQSNLGSKMKIFLKKNKFIIKLSIFILIPIFSLEAQVVSFKNDLFTNQVLESRRQYIRISYDEMRDVNGRDEVPEIKAHSNRVELLPSYESSKTIKSVSTNIAGSLNNFSFAVVFIHGAGGNKSLGFKDWTFGGNFNRLKNLVVRSGGVYLSPTAQLNSRGASKIGGMLAEVKKSNPRSKLILSCGSKGGFICWNLIQNPKYSELIDGVILLGTAINNDKIPSTDFYLKAKPILFGHGTRDPVMPWQNVLNTSEVLKSNSIPTRFYLFDSGNHGTPIRMIDWKESLNWILNH